MEQTAEYTTNYICSLVMQKPIQYKQLGLIKKNPKHVRKNREKLQNMYWF